jgi:hypothetical protein
MSKISTVYTAIIDKMEALYPTKIRLHNPYELTENAEMVCKNSWGIAVEDASREDLEYCNLSILRTFKAIFLRQFVTLSSKEDGFDAITALLLEDQQTFLNAFYSPDEIGQQGIIERIDFTTISGVNQLVSGEKKYLFSEVTFNILISEAII